MPAVEVERVVAAAPAAVYRRVADMEAYPTYMRSVERITVLERQERRTLTEWVVHIHGMTLRWVEEDTFSPEEYRITYRQVRGDLRKFEGYWQIYPHEAGSRVVLLVDFEFGMPMLAGLLNPVAKVLIRENSEAMLEAIASAAE